MKKLEQIRQESKEIKDKIDNTEERLRQLKNQEKKILKQDIIKRRKERTHRLITRGAILESLIENAEELVGKTLLAITNLPPREMMGVESCGMLLSAVCEYEGEELLNLIMLDENISAGAKIY